MRGLTVLAAVAVAGSAAFFALPASAATEAQCKAALAQTHHDLRSSPEASMRPQSLKDRWQTNLLNAASAGVRGDPEKCLDGVKRVREDAGLPVK